MGIEWALYDWRKLMWALWKFMYPHKIAMHLICSTPPLRRAHLNDVVEVHEVPQEPSGAVDGPGALRGVHEAGEAQSVHPERAQAEEAVTTAHGTGGARRVDLTARAHGGG